MPFDGTSSPVTQTLIDARAKVEKGWCQHHGRSRGAVCAGFALVEAGCSETTIFIFEDVIKQPIITWNDAPDRTKEQVLAAFDRAIDLSLNA
jgi:hypothetical protein